MNPCGPPPSGPRRRSRATRRPVGQAPSCRPLVALLLMLPVLSSADPIFLLSHRPLQTKYALADHIVGHIEKSFLKANHNPDLNVKVSLIGSFANETATPESDLDVVIQLLPPRQPDSKLDQTAETNLVYTQALENYEKQTPQQRLDTLTWCRDHLVGIHYPINASPEMRDLLKEQPFWQQCTSVQAIPLPFKNSDDGTPKKMYAKAEFEYVFSYVPIDNMTMTMNDPRRGRVHTFSWKIDVTFTYEHKAIADTLEFDRSKSTMLNRLYEMYGPTSRYRFRLKKSQIEFRYKEFNTIVRQHFKQQMGAKYSGFACDLMVLAYIIDTILDPRDARDIQHMTLPNILNYCCEQLTVIKNMKHRKSNNTVYKYNYVWQMYPTVGGKVPLAPSKEPIRMHENEVLPGRENTKSEDISIIIRTFSDTPILVFGFENSQLQVFNPLPPAAPRTLPARRPWMQYGNAPVPFWYDPAVNPPYPGYPQSPRGYAAPCATPPLAPGNSPPGTDVGDDNSYNSGYAPAGKNPDVLGLLVSQSADCRACAGSRRNEDDGPAYEKAGDAAVPVPD